MTSRTTYKGYSTINAERNQRWTRYDIDLIKVDLMNQFHTRIGERVMRPNYGCRIWDYLNEPLTAALREQIITEVVRIVQTDPRLALKNVNLFDFDKGIRIEITLDYVGLISDQTLFVDFQNSQNGGGL